MNLTRKARLGVGGYLHQQNLNYTTYSNGVSRESVRICFTLAALYNISLQVADMINVYLNAKPLENT